jgi:nascent polypeptide-associated complex subunit alpha
MPSVADELAALRAKEGGVKARAAGLDKGAGLSTPEAEEAALKAKKEQDKLGKASAKEILSKGGSGAASQELEHSLQQKAKKKAEQEKINEAKKSLSKGGSSYTKAAKGAEETTSPKAAAPQAPKEKETTDDVAAAVTEVEDVDDDDVPDLEEADDIPELDGGMDKIQQTAGDAESRQVTNRNEKKARKMMQRLGMFPVSGIERATFKTGGQGGYFFIDNPDVYTMGKTYVIFGEARQGGNMQQQQAAMAQAQAQAAMAQQQQQAAGIMPSVAEEGVEVEEMPELAEESVDESGVDDKDINLVMSQASCSRAKAVKALKENDNDLVNAIMSLTT